SPARLSDTWPNFAARELLCSDSKVVATLSHAPLVPPSEVSRCPGPRRLVARDAAGAGSLARRDARVSESSAARSVQELLDSDYSDLTLLEGYSRRGEAAWLCVRQA